MVTEDGHAFMPSAPGAPADGLRNLVLDGEFRGHLLDSKGVTMKMGRKHRLVTDGQATALLARWLFQCAMPGCNHARFLEFHHITEYCAGGRTDVGNLVPLCSACHSLVTNGLASIDIDAADTGLLRFSFCDGSTYHSRNRGLPEKTTSADLFGAPVGAGPAKVGDWDEELELSFDDAPVDDSARAEKDRAEKDGDPDEPGRRGT